MKKSLLISLFTLSLFSCTQEDKITPIEQSKTLDVTILGNSPEFWYHNVKTNTTTYIRQSHIVMNVNKGDVITAIGFSYSIDNSNNYNAPNVVVVGEITFKVNGVVVANGVNNLSYQIK
jgi:hypothetical protein